MPKNSRFKLSAALLSVIIFASGCAQIPAESEAKVGPQVKTADGTEYVYYNPQPPQLGQTAIQVVTGFINAGTGPQNDYSVARQFLGLDFRSRWSPSDQVLVESGTPEVEIVDSTQVNVTVKVQAEVDAAGNYIDYPAAVERVLVFKLSEENGQMRIIDAPNLTILVRPVFDVLFSAYSLYFFDNAKQYLVPDLRWFPARASTSTRMVNSLLEGPSKWLRSAVTTPMPSGTKLAIDAVTVTQGVASVNLDTRALQANSTQLRQFKAQLSATLKQLPNVSDVQLLVDGNIKNFQDFVPEQPSSETAYPVVLGNSVLRFANQDSTIQLQVAQSLVQRVNAYDFALSANRRELALLGKDGLYWAKLGQIGNRLEVLDDRPKLLSPVFDHADYIWSVSREAESQILLIGRDGKKIELTAEWLKPYEKLDFAVSPSGSRVAFVVRHAGKTHVLVSAVARDLRGTPAKLGAPLNLTVAGLNGRSVTWVGENDIVALYNSKNVDGSLPFRSVIGGSTVSLGTTTPGVQVLSSSAGTNIFLLGRSGSVYKYNGFTWNLITDNVSAAHMAE